MTDTTVSLNPFIGLRAFEENEDYLFFGREKQINELLKKLHETRFLSVVGSSGSGKSSLVKSGLLPSIYSGFMSVGSNWRVATIRPGNDPIGFLARELAREGVLYEKIEDDIPYATIIESTLRRSSNGIADVYKQSHLPTTENLIVVVDQFEEIFRFAKYEKENNDGVSDSLNFINLLLTAAQQRDFPIYILITMRSDFLGDCTQFRGLPEAINSGQYLIPRMTREEIREAITGPIAVGGAEISQRLITRLLNDLGNNPDQLPILQHALMRTWDHWQKKEKRDEPIDLDDYEEIGTMSSALSMHAEEAYAELASERKKIICEKVFKALTDKSADARGTRRPTSLTDLAKLCDATEDEVKEVIFAFRKQGRTFLMPPAKVNVSGNTVIDISHESLMRVWERLIKWVDDELQSSEIYNRLAEASVLYERGKTDLWRNPELQFAWNWKENTEPNNSWASRYNNLFEKAMLFLEHSKNEFDFQEADERRRAKMRLRRARVVSIIISVIGIVSIFLAVVALEKKFEADSAKTKAQNAEKNANHLAKVAQDSATSAKNSRLEISKNIAALQELNTDLTNSKVIVQSQAFQLSNSLAELQKTFSDLKEQKKLSDKLKDQANKSRDSARDAQAYAIQQAALALSLKNLAFSRVTANKSIMYFNEGNYDSSLTLAIRSYNLNATENGPEQSEEIYNALHHNWSRKERNRNQMKHHQYPVRSICLMQAKSNFIFSADESGKIIESEIKPDSLHFVQELSYSCKKQIRSITCSPDGKFLVAGTFDGGILIYQTANLNAKPVQLFYHEKLKKIVFAGKSEFIVICADGAAKYSVSENGSVLNDSLLRKNISTIEVSASGKIYVAQNKLLLVYSNWNSFKQNNILLTCDVKNSPINAVAFSNDEKYLAAGTLKGSLVIFGSEGNIVVPDFTLHQSQINDLEFCMVDGRLQLASASADRTIKLLDVNNRSEDIISLTDHTKWVYSLLYNADGSMLISSSEDTKVIGWKPCTKELYEELIKK